MSGMKLRRMWPVLSIAGLALAFTPGVGNAATANPAAASVSGSSIARASVSWPAVISEAVSYARTRTAVPLMAPARLPAAGPAPNSALVHAGGSYYSVALYACAAALPVNNPGIGSGTCSAMASIYGAFGGNTYRSAAAAVASLPEPSAADRAGCPDATRVTLPAGIVATLYTDPAAHRNCEAIWREGAWRFELTGDLNGGTGGDGTEPWPGVAAGIISYLASHHLPRTPGFLESDIAGDGLHTGLYWALGRDVYSASTYHGATPAISLAIAMTRYPGNRQIAADEAFVASAYGNCAAFTPSPHHCSFAVAATGDGAGGRLYAVELRSQTGDDCERGIVYFFDGTRFAGRTRDLPPSSVGGVTRVNADGAGRFAVVYLVDKNAFTSCAAGGDAGTDTYVYRWTGHRMVRQSGVLPRLPEVILGTGVTGPWPR
jgi:hypothetical protein